jgi:hypothetical protein
VNVVELLTRQSGEHRALSENESVAVTQYKPAVGATAQALADARTRREDLERQLAAAREDEARAQSTHDAAVAELKRHEDAARQAGEVAALLDELAARLAKDLAPAPPAQALADAMHVPVEQVDPLADLAPGVVDSRAEVAAAVAARTGGYPTLQALEDGEPLTTRGDLPPPADLDKHRHAGPRKRRKGRNEPAEQTGEQGA